MGAQAINQLTTSGILIPPRHIPARPRKEIGTVESLKTFIVPKKKGKRTVFYKGEAEPRVPVKRESWGASQFTGGMEAVPEMYDMPNHVKHMCRKQKIPQQQSNARSELFQAVWYPKQVWGQLPFPRNDTRGLGYGKEDEPMVYYAVNMISIASTKQDHQQAKKA